MLNLILEFHRVLQVPTTSQHISHFIAHLIYVTSNIHIEQAPFMSLKHPQQFFPITNLPSFHRLPAPLRPALQVQFKTINTTRTVKLHLYILCSLRASSNHKNTKNST